MMQFRTEIEIGLTSQERMALVESFARYLARFDQLKATAADLQVLQRIGEVGLETAAMEEPPLQDLLQRLSRLMGLVTPHSLTLSEAAQLCGVNAATLRRACWRQALPGQKRGKTWFVREADLEVYLSRARLRAR